uniref:Ubiquitin-like domain-containing protein n=1 Tax=Caenorhabditis tropicalis TaxID=1561998 RepID=A0A1I7TGL5_9PELO
MCENSILSEIEQLRVDGSGVRVTLEKIAPNEVSIVEFEEMRKDQMKFNKEVLETLRLMRQEIKENQNQIKMEVKNMKEEQKKVMKEVKSVQEDQKKMLKEQNKSEGKVLNKLQLVMENQKKMEMELKNVKEEQKKMKEDMKESKQKTMDSLKSVMTEVKSVQKKQEQNEKKVMDELKGMKIELMKTMKEEQEKVLREIEGIRNKVTTSEEDSEEKVSEPEITTTDHLPYLEILYFSERYDDDLTVPMLPTDTIFDLKEKIAVIEGVPEYKQRIYFEDMECEDDHETLEECGFQDGSIFVMEAPYEEYYDEPWYQS